MNSPAMPFSLVFDLGSLSDRGAEFVLAPAEAERRAIAGWLGIEALERLEAAVAVSRTGGDQYAYTARFEADVVQACVITLEPVRSHLSGDFHRIFQVLPRVVMKRRKVLVEPPASLDLCAADDDEPEMLEDPHLDLAGPVLEELSLALDPYPKAPGVAFEAPVEAAAPSESPFAVLEKLKTAESGPAGARKSKSAGQPKSRSSGGKRD